MEDDGMRVAEVKESRIWRMCWDIDDDELKCFEAWR